MELSGTLRDLIWPASDWQARILELTEQIERTENPWERSDRFFELGLLSEYAIPNREQALTFYRLAWKATGGHYRALIRAQSLCRELTALDRVARLAALEFKQTSDPTLLVVAGEAWLDAGEPDRAITPLLKALELLPTSDRARDALEVARVEPDAVEAEVARARELAESADPRAAAQLFLKAARMLRRHTQDRPACEQMARSALEKNPRDERANTLLASLLERARRWGDLVELYEQRADAARTDHERVDAYRRGGMALAVRFSQPEHGAKLLSRALATAYERRMSDVPGHLAMLRLLRDRFEETGELPRLLALSEDAFRTDLSTDEQLYISMLAGSVAWKSLRNLATASRYFVRIRAIVPDHPLLAAFERSTRRQAEGRRKGESTARGGREAQDRAKREAVERARREAEERARRIAQQRATRLAGQQRERKPDRRRAGRIVKRSLPVDVRAKDESEAEFAFRGFTRDFNEHGVFVMTRRLVPVGTRLALRFHIPREEGWRENVYDIEACVIRVKPNAGFAADLLNVPLDFRREVESLRHRK